MSNATPASLRAEADAADILALEPGIQHRELRAAEIIGREADGEKHRQPHQPQDNQPPGAQPLQADP